MIACPEDILCREIEMSETWIWGTAGDLTSRRFTCGYCGRLVASSKGFPATVELNRGSREMAFRSFAHIYVCPHCSRPSFFYSDDQIPGCLPGAEVKNLPDDVEQLYKEIRKAVAGGAPTAAVLACRKLLMHIAVNNGAADGKTFFQYVEYLRDKNYLPPNGHAWVDHIRAKGNEANHEIVISPSSDALELIDFIEMLLKFIYEFPSRLPVAPNP